LIHIFKSIKLLNGNLVVRILSVIIIFQIVSCIPIPWTKVDYKSLGTNHFRINNGSVKVFMRAHDETIESGSPPYRVYVTSYGEYKYHDSMIVHSISAFGESGVEFDVYPASRIAQKGKWTITKLTFPIKKTFEKGNEKLNWAWACIETDDTIDPMIQEDEIVKIFVDIEVITTEKSERMKIECSFEPKRKNGLFRSLD